MTLIGAPAAVYIWGPSTRYLLTNYNLQIEYVDFGPATFHLYPAHVSVGSASQCAAFHA